MNKITYIFTLLICMSFAANAQDKKYVYQDSDYIDEPKVFYDSVKTQTIEVKPDENNYAADDEENVEYIDTTLYYNEVFLERDSVNYLKNHKSFAYVKYLDSLLKEKQRKEKDEPKEKKERIGNSWIETLFSSSIFGGILWALAIIFILFILYKLFFAEGVFQRNSKKEDDVKELVAEEEITPNTNFEKLIQQAELDGNYRLAIRYQYLKRLHALAEQNYIQLTADKTNYQYVQEINNEVIRNAFAKITLNYEYVWYGEFEIDNNLYQQLKTSFNNI